MTRWNMNFIKRAQMLREGYEHSVQFYGLCDDDDDDDAQTVMTDKPMITVLQWRAARTDSVTSVCRQCCRMMKTPDTHQQRESLKFPAGILPPGPGRRFPCGSGTCRGPRNWSPPARRWSRKRWRTAAPPPACGWRWWPWRPSPPGGRRNERPGPPGREVGSRSATGRRRRRGREGARTKPAGRSWSESVGRSVTRSVTRTGTQHINNKHTSGLTFQNKR